MPEPDLVRQSPERAEATVTHHEPSFFWRSRDTFLELLEAGDPSLEDDDGTWPADTSAVVLTESERALGNIVGRKAKRRTRSVPNANSRSLLPWAAWPKGDGDRSFLTVQCGDHNRADTAGVVSASGFSSIQISDGRAHHPVHAPSEVGYGEARTLTAASAEIQQIAETEERRPHSPTYHQSTAGSNLPPPAPVQQREATGSSEATWRHPRRPAPGFVLSDSSASAAEAAAAASSASASSAQPAAAALPELWANSSVLMIKNIGCRCTPAQLRHGLQREGLQGMRDVYIPRREGANGPSTNFGYGFVSFTAVEFAQEAVRRLQGRPLVFGKKERVVEFAPATVPLRHPSA